MVLRSLAVAAALAALILSGLAQGRWTGRWKPSDELEVAVARLVAIPAEFGDWRGRSLDLNAKAVEVGEIAGYVSRRYEDRRTGEAVTVLIVCGRPGPIAVHTPDICYRGAGYEPAAPPAVDRVPIGPGARGAEFKTAKFRKEGPAETGALDIFWSWNTDGTWRAPANPRLALAPCRAVYKLYVIRAMDSIDDPDADAACRGFIRQFAPVLDEALFPTAPR